MSNYTPNIQLELDPVYTGMAADLRAQLYDGATQATVGSEMSGGFFEMAGAEAKYVYRPTIPNGHDGWCRVYPDGQPEITIAYFVINPVEMEPPDVSCPQPSISAIPFTYTLTSTASGTPPIAGATVWITTDLAGTQIVWVGTTTTLGVARDVYGALPLLEPGHYYFWRLLSGYAFDNPDQEDVS